MAQLKKKTTYYVGRPVKKGQVFSQLTVYVDADGKKHESDTHSRKSRDFADGFMGFGVSERAINISKAAFDKLK